MIDDLSSFKQPPFTVLITKEVPLECFRQGLYINESLREERVQFMWVILICKFYLKKIAFEF